METEHEFTVDRLDLDPHYGWLRENRPVSKIRLRNGVDAWLVTRWEDARRVFADPVFSRAQAGGLPFGARGKALSIADMDPPEHTRVRRIALSAFTHRRVQQMRPRIEQIAAGLLDDMAAHGAPADLVEHLALPLPVTVICELLGVPADDRDRFTEWSAARLSVSAHTPEQMAEAAAQLDAYLGELIAQRRTDPAGDLLSALAKLPADGDGLSSAELLSLATTLLVAGFETTASQIANFTYTLLDQRHHWERLVAEPDLVPAALEELLRLLPLGATPGLPRVATADVELSGVRIRKGDTVVVARTVASRDESVFANGDTLNFDRPENPHLAFGHGIHHCLGAHLARLELQVTFGALLARFPDLRLAVPKEELRWKDGLAVRGLRELPVTWAK
ncbi:cytochrome P450 [Actinomadura rudentiformis]|uniref:Cytochrome P450 n=1 Tax=Actinomadura rudentiformis TaxID=359158 RepID=A0A6H9YHT1_9ACTN|nr:cytochrome P450 [Actinomadura rudentiformis]KAB2340225.1 cytochrome P450 [Actinomadura rudentiformis]